MVRMPTTNLPSSNLNRAHWLNPNSTSFTHPIPPSSSRQPHYPTQTSSSRITKSSFTPTTLTQFSTILLRPIESNLKLPKMKQIKFSTKMNKFNYTCNKIVLYFYLSLLRLQSWRLTCVNYISLQRRHLIWTTLVKIFSKMGSGQISDRSCFL